MEPFEVARLDRYFALIADRFPAARDAGALLITHLLADRPSFVRAVALLAEVRAVLPKPSSVNPAALGLVRQAFTVDALSREQFAQEQRALSYLEQRASGVPMVLLDVGGYFAPTLARMCERFSGQILGVVEDTENGYRRYLDLVSRHALSTLWPGRRSSSPRITSWVSRSCSAPRRSCAHEVTSCPAATPP